MYIAVRLVNPYNMYFIFKLDGRNYTIVVLLVTIGTNEVVGTRTVYTLQSSPSSGAPTRITVVVVFATTVSQGHASTNKANGPMKNILGGIRGGDMLQG